MPRTDLQEAQLLLEMGRFDEAIRRAEQVLRKDPKGAQAHRIIGVCRLELGDVAAALPPLTKAVQLDRKYGAAHYNLACAYARLKMKDQMLESLKKAVAYGLSETSVDYRIDALTDADFRGFRDDKDFNSIVFPVPPDPVLRDVYGALRDRNLRRVLERGEKGMDQTTDLSALLQAMHGALEMICSDLREHGEGHVALYEYADYLLKEGLRSQFFFDYLKRLGDQIEKLRAAGSLSEVYERFVHPEKWLM